MVSRIVKVEPFDLVVFGGTGDLAFRKLYPALFRRYQDGQLTEPTRILAISRQEITPEDFRARVAGSLRKISGHEASELDSAKGFFTMLDYCVTDGNGERGWDDLKARLGDTKDRVRAFYLATSPDLFGPVTSRLAAHGLVSERARIIVEKPLGKDGASAARINDAIGAVFSEDRIYRIDHYLGKETVQNLMVLRFANALFEPLWNAAHIDHVQITVAECLGVEGRAAYYDTAGALRDMVQNHMLQLLCLIAMEPPATLDADAMRDEKLKVLRALKPLDEQNVTLHTVRGQYRAGSAHGSAVPGYLEELGQDRSMTETFVALKAEVENWRWAGVPFYLRTGKRLASRVSEIVVAFRPIPHSVFGTSTGSIAANRLVLRLQPDEGVKLWVMIKDPGPGGMRLQYVPLDMTFAEAFHTRYPDAYERLLLDVVRGNQTLFMRRDEVEAAWRWIDPILEAWRNSGEWPKPYLAGTWGPSASIALIERDGRTWFEDSF